MDARPPLDPARLDALRRTSGLRVHTEGHLLHHGEPFDHARLEALFLAGLDLHPDSGEAIVRVGSQWCYVGCDATPFVVQAARTSASGVELRLNTGETLHLAPAALQLWLQGDHRLWLQLPATEQHPARWARCARRSWQRLAEHLQPLDDDQLQLAADGWQVSVLQSKLDPLQAPLA